MKNSKLSILVESQISLLREFYSMAYTKVIFNKNERDNIWNDFKNQRTIPNKDLDTRCPALLAELNKAIINNNLVQSAVFSECVYAQTFANMLQLRQFYIFSDTPDCLSESIIDLLSTHHLNPRYVYKSLDGNRFLVQAGGFAGIDSALLTINGDEIFTVEYKEPGSKTSEPDLPAYQENGFLVKTDSFLNTYSHFETMLNEQLEKNLNFWDVMGSNVNDFSEQGVQIAVSENYATKKYADVICVEDIHGFLTMIPANEAGNWANLKGEIRPAGRNAYAVWTPGKLIEFLTSMGGKIVDGEVELPSQKLTSSKKRGGNNEISRYKINPLFFVRTSDVRFIGSRAVFELKKVKQLRPTISAHMFFRDLKVQEVHAYYRSEF